MISRAARSVSRAENATCDSGTGTPRALRRALPWYSWIFMLWSPDGRRGMGAPGGDRLKPPLGGHRDARLPTPGRGGLTVVREEGDDLAHGIGRDLEHALLLVAELHLDDLLDPARAEHGGHADEQVLVAVLALAQARAGQDALLVA